MKKIIYCLLALFMFLSVSTVKADETLLTIDDYKVFLESNSPNDLATFNQLTVSQQQEIVDKLLDPETYNPENMTLIDTRTVSDRSGSRYTIATNGVALYGISLLEYKVETSYATSRGRATQIYGHHAYVSRNLSPLTQTGKLSSYAWISNGNAHVSAKFYYRVGPIKGLSVQIGTVCAEVASNGYGQPISNYWYNT